MPRNNSKAQKTERRRRAAVRLRLHASNPHGCDRAFSKHSDEQHADMLAEAKRIEEIR